MLPTLVDAPFSHADWLFEPKLDGFRTVALVDGTQVRLLSRRGLDMAGKFPELMPELRRQSEKSLVLDGEVVAVDEHGRPSFHALQQRTGFVKFPETVKLSSAALVYYAFDLLHLGGYDLRATPLEVRKQLLQDVLVPLDRVRPVEFFDEAGEIAYQACVEHGFEGVVAKKRGSRYEEGKRSRQWLKVKHTMSAEFVVGGYAEGQGPRADSLGALLVGAYDTEGRLHYVAHVGSGFDHRLLRDLG